MLKSFKYRLRPTEVQTELINKHIGSSRFVYNLALETKTMAYAGNQVNLSCFDLIKQLPDLKKECIWLKEINSQSLQAPIRNLDNAFTRFYKGQGNFPKYKSKKKGKQSFHIPQNVIVENGKLIIPKFKEGIEIVLHRETKGVIKSATISRTPTGKYFVSILCDTGEDCKQKSKIKKETTVGIDLGIKDFLITSDNKKFKNNRYTKKYAKQLKKAQQHLSRKQKGSNGFEKQKLKVAKIHEKIASCRLDTLHKVSKELVESYDLISIEDLNVKGMIKNHKLSKHIADASWGNFVTLLQYKCNWYGKELVKVNRFYPSSKTCGDCGWINQELKLSDREWTCKSCGVVHDRDVNASRNILKEGLKIFGQGLSKTKVEDKSDYSGSTSVETRSPSHRFSVGG